MSKKIASGADSLVLDVKMGNGAFMKNIEDARELSTRMVNLGKLVNLKTIAIVTNMDSPLGEKIGNSLEVKEAIEVLKGNGPEDLKEVCLVLATYMVALSLDISKEKMLKILNEILAMDIKDQVKFDVVKITDIRPEDEYGGNKYHIVAKLENLKVSLEIDISTGDEITPKELNYEYISIFDNKKIYIDTYNIETILSEKIETILRRGKYNTRIEKLLVII